MQLMKCGIFIILFIPNLAFAIFDDSIVSFSASVIPSLANQDVDHIPGSSALDDSAYQFQASFTFDTKDHIIAKTVREYIAIRAFKFIENYEEEGAEGASALEGLAVLYGQRYMFTDKTYNGFGVGWYAGAAMGTDTYVEVGFNTTPIQEDLFAPLAAAEAFYRHSISQLFFEASGVLGLNKDTSGVTFLPGIFVGYEF